MSNARSRGGAAAGGSRVSAQQSSGIWHMTAVRLLFPSHWQGGQPPNWRPPVPHPRSSTDSPCQVPKGGRRRSRSASTNPACHTTRPTRDRSSTAGQAEVEAEGVRCRSAQENASRSSPITSTAAVRTPPVAPSNATHTLTRQYQGCRLAILLPAGAACPCHAVVIQGPQGIAAAQVLPNINRSACHLKAAALQGTLLSTAAAACAACWRAHAPAGFPAVCLAASACSSCSHHGYAAAAAAPRR